MPSLLLVDDSQLARRVLGRRLTEIGVRVGEASSMAEVQAGGAASLAPLLGAVLDLELGDGDGVALAAWLREGRPSLPIAFFTAAHGPLVERALAYGPVFAKPDADAVVRWARELLFPGS
jgi:CheY-like chemotaxis protein